MSAADALISPALSAQTPLGSLSGWAIVVHCRRCGERSRAVEKIATKPSIYARPLGEIVQKFTCSGCGASPTKLEAECVWAKAALPPRTRIDLTWLLPAPDGERQASLL